MQRWLQVNFPTSSTVCLILLIIWTAQLGISDVMRFTKTPGLLVPALGAQMVMSQTVDLSWHAPKASNINNLSTAINSTGVYGFIFNSSTLPQGTPYGTYDWCNMPHVRPQEYKKANGSFQLQYVELIHRHHKRTPYAANTFPVENYPWYCDDEGLFFYGEPLPEAGKNHSASAYWAVYTSPSNPLAPQGFNGTCQFPQITKGGLDDSWQHGLDLYHVYHEQLNLIPSSYNPNATFYRVTNNVITSQVAGMVINAMYPSRHETHTPTPLAIQPDSIDSLEPAYTCTAGSALYSSYGSGSNGAGWQSHLRASASLFTALDAISGVSPSNSGFHVSWDHYFDNLSSRLCHAKPLPCSVNNTAQCVTQAQADEVFRLGQWEYSYTYRDAGQQTLDAAVATYGIYVAELAQNLRDAVSGKGTVRYRHNVAHDGSLSRLLSILQVETMVWPGMGSEVVFELYKAKNGFKGASASGNYLRVLWGGQVLRSSTPTLGVMDMVPLETVLAYFDGLVGVGASLVPGKCRT